MAQDLLRLAFKRKTENIMFLIEKALLPVFYTLNDDQDKFIKLKFDRPPEELLNHKLVISLYPNDKRKLSKNSKKKGIGSDNFYIEKPVEKNIDVGNSKIIIQRLNTKISEQDILKIKLYFYEENDALKLASHDVILNTMD